MKILIALIVSTASINGEPPVGDGYPGAALSRSNHDHHNYQRTSSLSQEYGLPNQYRKGSDKFSGLRRAQPSSEYGVPSARESLRTVPRAGYSLPSSRTGVSQEYGPPSSRSRGAFSGYPSTAKNALSQEYGVPFENSFEDEFSLNSLSNEYLPPARSLSTEYGSPLAKDSFSQGFNVPSARGFPGGYNDLSRSRLSQEYGVPTSRSGLSDEYGPPFARNGLDQDFGAVPKTISRNVPSQNYGPPNFRSSGYSQGASSFASRSFNSGFGGSRGFKTPGSTISRGFGIGSDSYLQGYESKRPLSMFRGAGSGTARYNNLGRTPSSEYGAPNSRSGLKTLAKASSFGLGPPATTYGVPSRQAQMLGGYPLPDQYNALNDQGYKYGRNSDDNQEPAHYNFEYKVNDVESGSDFGHTEMRDNNRAEGSYFVVLPDGTKQVVEYEADESGFKPRISVEPLDAAGRGGYDENAANIDSDVISARSEGYAK